MHRYIIGHKGHELLPHLVLDADLPVVVIDPDGTLTDTVLSHRPHKTVLFDPTDIDWPIAFNPLYAIPEEMKHRVADAMVETIRDIAEYDIATPDMNLAIYSLTRSLLDTNNGTVLGLFNLLVSERSFGHVKDPVVRKYLDVFETYPDKDKRQLERSALNKVIDLVGDPYLRNVLGQPVPKLDVLDVLDKGQSVFVRLPQAKLGVHGMKALGSLFFTHLHHKTLGTKRGYHVILPNCHHFGGRTLSQMLAGDDVQLTLCHQYLAQIGPKLRTAILGRAGKTYIFRTGIEDSTELMKTIPPNNINPVLHELAPLEARVFSDFELPMVKVEPLGMGSSENVERVVKRSRAKYAGRRVHVERHIHAFLGG